MTLTEQWKKGELSDGMYYMENTSGIIGMVGHSKAFPCYNVKQILAPVPSYEEWKTVFNCATKYEVEYVKCVNDYEELWKKNQQLKERNDSLNNRDINLCRIANGIRDENFALKELLKECTAHLTLGEIGTSVTPLNILLDEIDNAIGEK